MQALGDYRGAGFYLRICQRRQLLRAALSGKDGFQDLHAADPAQIAQYVAELDVHLNQRLLHSLDRTAGLRHQPTSVPPQRA